MHIHVVQSGDTLRTLASRYKLTIQQIAFANGLAVSAALVSGQALVIPTSAPKQILQSNSKPFKEVNAYITNLGSPGQSLIGQIGDDLTYLSPFSYKVNSDGTLQGLNDQRVLESARSKNVSPLMSIANLDDQGFNSNIAHVLLNNASVQRICIDNILNIMTLKGYRGLNIDFEYVPSADWERYNYFLEQLVNRLHFYGYSVSSALAPKLSAKQRGLLYEAHDYAVHGQLLDFVVLMTYEWGWAGGPPMAIAPLNMVKRVLDYAVTVVSRDKIMLGIELFARDWTLPYAEGGPNARTFTPEYAIQLAARYHTAIQYDQTSQSPFFRYGDDNGRNHIVWLEDARSMQAKFKLVKDYRLRGISYWALPTSFPQVWLVQEDSFNVLKV
jgi:spore germination protein